MKKIINITAYILRTYLICLRDDKKENFNKQINCNININNNV